MANLRVATMTALASYPQSRNGHSVPFTDRGSVYEYACWCWALSGGQLRDNSPTSYRIIQNDIIRLGEAGTFPAEINHAVVGNYPGCAAHFTALQDMLDTYDIVHNDRSIHNPFSVNDLTFLDALVQIIARMNGLTITGAATGNLGNIASTYSLHVRSNNCWSIDHWALGIRPGIAGGMNRMYVQTIPNTDLRHNCNAVWDEGLAIAHFNLQTLLPAHVSVLDHVRAYRAPAARRMSF